MPFASPPSSKAAAAGRGSSTATSVKATPLTFSSRMMNWMRSPLVPVPVSALPFSFEVDEVRTLGVRLVERHQGRGRRWRQRRIGAGVVADRLGLRPLGARGRLVVNGAGGNVGRGDPVIALEGPGLVDVEQAIEVVVADRADPAQARQVAQQNVRERDVAVVLDREGVVHGLARIGVAVRLGLRHRRTYPSS